HFTKLCGDTWTRLRFGNPAFFLFADISSGGLVHGELARRSRFLFALQHDPPNGTNPDDYRARISQWLSRHDGSILAGSFMPDWYVRAFVPYLMKRIGDMVVRVLITFPKQVFAVLIRLS